MEFILLFLFLIITVIFLFNNPLANINLKWGTWKTTVIIPPMKQVGSDFRDGWYRPAVTLLNGGSPSSISQYPPFVTVMALPLTLLSETYAYLVQVGLLSLLNLATMILMPWMIIELFPMQTEPWITKMTVLGLLFLGAFYHFSGYPFAFSIERGNYDIYAVFFALLGVWVLIRKPKWIWLQVLLISIGAQLKIYPAVLLLLVFWKHKEKMILPAILVNAGLLFILGPREMMGFLSNITHSIESPSTYLSNHSSLSFIAFIQGWMGAGNTPSPLLKGIIIALPLVLFAVACLMLIPGGYSEQKAVWGFVCSLPVMLVLPSVSQDYTLVILTCGLLFLIYVLIRRFVETGDVKPLIYLLLIGVDMFFLSRSFAILPKIIQHKWPFILILQGLMLAVQANYGPLSPFHLSFLATRPGQVSERSEESQRQS
jgi:hypothetical protein